MYNGIVLEYMLSEADRIVSGSEALVQKLEGNSRISDIFFPTVSYQ